MRWAQQGGALRLPRPAECLLVRLSARALAQDRAWTAAEHGAAGGRGCEAPHMHAWLSCLAAERVGGSGRVCRGRMRGLKMHARMRGVRCRHLTAGAPRVQFCHGSPTSRPRWACEATLRPPRWAFGGLTLTQPGACEDHCGAGGCMRAGPGRRATTPTMHVARDVQRFCWPPVAVQEREGVWLRVVAERKPAAHSSLRSRGVRA